MKFKLSLIITLCFSFSNFAQDISILRFEEDVFTDVTGATIELSFECTKELEFEIRLEEGETPFEFSIERVVIEEEESLESYLFMKSEGAIDNVVYPKGVLEGVNPFVAPDFMTAMYTELTGPSAPGFALRYDCSENSNCADYMYYIINEMDERIDSVRIKFCTTVSIDDKDLFKQVEVFPNPTKDIININLSNNTSEIYAMTLIDLSGKVIWKSPEHLTNNVTIDLTTYDTGIYFLNLLSTKEEEVQEVIKVFKTN